MNFTRRGAMALMAGTVTFPSAISANEFESTAEVSEWSSVFPLCSCSTNQDNILKFLIVEFAEFFNCKLLNGLESNPRCCVWFQIVGAANPGSAGWHVWHQQGGTIITATDAEQMKDAIRELSRLSKKRNEQHSLPIGIITNFPVTTV